MGEAVLTLAIVRVHLSASPVDSGLVLQLHSGRVHLVEKTPHVFGGDFELFKQGLQGCVRSHRNACQQDGVTWIHRVRQGSRECLKARVRQLSQHQLLAVLVVLVRWQSWSGVLRERGVSAVQGDVAIATGPASFDQARGYLRAV